MSSIFPGQNVGGIVVVDAQGNATGAPGIPNAYIPPSTFHLNCALRYYGTDCTITRFDPGLINGLASEMLALAAAFNCNGAWDCNSNANLAALFKAWTASTAPANGACIGGLIWIIDQEISAWLDDHMPHYYADRGVRLTTSGYFESDLGLNIRQQLDAHADPLLDKLDVYSEYLQTVAEQTPQSLMLRTLAAGSGISLVALANGQVRIDGSGGGGGPDVSDWYRGTATAGTATALTTTLSPTLPVTPDVGSCFRCPITTTNGANATIDFGIGAKPIVINHTGGVLLGGELPGGVGFVADFEWDGTHARLLNHVQAAEAVAGIAKVATQVQANAGADDTTIITPKKLKQYLIDNPQPGDPWGTGLGAVIQLPASTNLGATGNAVGETRTAAQLKSGSTFVTLNIFLPTMYPPGSYAGSTSPYTIFSDARYSTLAGTWTCVQQVDMGVDASYSYKHLTFKRTA